MRDEGKSKNRGLRLGCLVMLQANRARAQNPGDERTKGDADIKSRIFIRKFH